MRFSTASESDPTVSLNSLTLLSYSAYALSTSLLILSRPLNSLRCLSFAYLASCFRSAIIVSFSSFVRSRRFLVYLFLSVMQALNILPFVSSNSLILVSIFATPSMMLFRAFLSLFITLTHLSRFCLAVSTFVSSALMSPLNYAARFLVARDSRSSSFSISPMSFR